MSRARLVQSALRAALLLPAFALVLAGCSVDPESNPAFGCEGCDGMCMLGFCVGLQADGGTGGAAGGAGNDDGGLSGTGGATADGGMPMPEDCDEPGQTEFCYEGPGGTATTGSCKAGMRVCGMGVWSNCLGQVLPEEEQCNREDDDCDGRMDEELVLGTCMTGQPGACDEGALRCETGIAVCTRAQDPAEESCNDVDDDCDGELDEDLSPLCYPGAPDGCVDDGAGGFTCTGLCMYGVASCVDGQPQQCAGHIGPIAEACTTSGPAQDEDCDGQIDNGCMCGSGDSQECYSGSDETLGVGICMAGMQFCDTSSSSYGPCMDEVLPGTETCANPDADDNCNGTDDDIDRLGAPCTVEDAKGLCGDGTYQCVNDSPSLTCVGPDPIDETCNGHDDDCDGNTDEGLLGTNAHCTACNEPCLDDDPSGTDPRARCCEGACVDTDTDPLHCGSCGNDCGEGLTCCSGRCANLNSDPMNCSECGMQCPLGGCCQDAKCSSIVICF